MTTFPGIYTNDVISNLPALPADVGEPHLAVLERKLARVEALASAYNVPFFGKQPQRNTARYTPYTREPRTSCVIAVQLGGQIFFTCQIYEMLHPYSRAVLRALHGCDLSKPMFAFLTPKSFAKPHGKATLYNEAAIMASKDGLFLEAVRKAYHYALAHIVQLLALPRDSLAIDLSQSRYLTRAAEGHILYDLFGRPSGTLLEFIQGMMKQERTGVAGSTMNRLSALSMPMESDRDFVGLTCFPMLGSSAADDNDDYGSYLPTECVDIWVGLAPPALWSSTNPESAGQEEGWLDIVPAAVLDRYNEWLRPIFRFDDLAAELRIVKVEEGRKLQLHKSFDWSLLKFIRILVVRDQTNVFSHVEYAARMTVEKWDVIYRLTKLAEQYTEANRVARILAFDDAEIATSVTKNNALRSGILALLSQMMEWRRLSLLTGALPYNTLPVKTAYFVFQLDNL